MKNFFLFILTLFLGVVLLSAENIKILPEKMFTDFNFAYVQKAIKFENNYYILESTNHRILVFNSSMKKTGQISKIGQEKGELYYPYDFTIKNSTIYVIDGIDRNISRVQLFNLDGKYKEGFTTDGISYGFDVNSNEEIFLGRPGKDKLVDVFSKEGKLLRSIGELAKLSQFYGDVVKKQDEEYKEAINIVNICIDKDDNLFFAFLGAPYFREYDKDGHLLLEKQIQGSEADMIVKAFKTEKLPATIGIVSSTPTPKITTGIAVDNQTGIIAITFQWYKGWIYLTDQKSEKSLILEPDLKISSFANISITADLVLLMQYSSKMTFNEIYRTDIKPYQNKLSNK